MSSENKTKMADHSSWILQKSYHVIIIVISGQKTENKSEPRKQTRLTFKIFLNTLKKDFYRFKKNRVADIMVFQGKNEKRTWETLENVDILDQFLNFR